MWHKAELMGHPMRLELTRVGLLVKLANRYTTKGAPNRSQNKTKFDKFNKCKHVEFVLYIFFLFGG